MSDPAPVGYLGLSPLLDRTQCQFALIDVQPLFLSWSKTEDPALLQRLRSYLLLCKAFQIPTLVTLEAPLEKKGHLAGTLSEVLGPDAVTLTKQTFDLSAEPEIATYLESTPRNHVVLAGCETDVCVLQSCLGLLAKGKHVFLLVDGIFSSALNVQPALDRMIQAGAQPLTYKSFFYELLRTVDRSQLPKQIAQALDEAEESGDLLDPEDVEEPPGGARG